MDDNTFKLLTALAQKLGTTAEYLWGVLIRQAFVDAMLSLVGVIVVTVLFVGWLMLYAKFITPGGIWSSEDGYRKHEDERTYGGILLAVLGVLALLIWFFVAPDILTGLLNPGYWALREILHAVK